MLNFFLCLEKFLETLQNFFLRKMIGRIPEVILVAFEHFWENSYQRQCLKMFLKTIQKPCVHLFKIFKPPSPLVVFCLYINFEICMDRDLLPDTNPRINDHVLYGRPLSEIHIHILEKHDGWILWNFSKVLSILWEF